MQSRPKIGVVCPFPFPIDRGSPLRAFKMCESLSKDFDIHVITYHIGNEGEYPFKIHRILNLPLRWEKAGASYKKLICDIFLLFKALKVSKKENFRLLHGHLHEGALIGEIVRLFLDIPIIYDAHGTLVKEMVETGFLNKFSLMLNFWKFLESKIQNNADYIVAQSEMRKNALVEDGINPKKILVITDAAKISKFSQKDKEKFKKKCGWEGYDILLYSGSLHKYQGVDILLKSFKKVIKKRPHTLLVFFSSQNIELYKQRINKLNLRKRVVFIDMPYSYLPKFLAVTDIALAPRLYDGNVPGKVMDYVASGVPIIGSKVKGIMDVIEDGETGILVRPGDKKALSDVIIRLLENPDLRKKITKNVRKLAEEKFNWNKNIQNLKKEYYKLLKHDSCANVFDK